MSVVSLARYKTMFPQMGTEQEGESSDCAAETVDHTRDVVHEMRSDLTSMLLIIEMITKVDGNNLSESSHERLRRLWHTAQHLSELASQIATPGTLQNGAEGRNHQQGGKR